MWFTVCISFTEICEVYYCGSSAIYESREIYVAQFCAVEYTQVITRLTAMCSIARKALVTCADEASNGISTISIHITVMCTIFTFINVYIRDHNQR